MAGVAIYSMGLVQTLPPGEVSIGFVCLYECCAFRQGTMRGLRCTDGIQAMRDFQPVVSALMNPYPPIQVCSTSCLFRHSIDSLRILLLGLLPLVMVLLQSFFSDGVVLLAYMPMGRLATTSVTVLLY